MAVLVGEGCWLWISSRHEVIESIVGGLAGLSFELGLHFSCNFGYLAGADAYYTQRNSGRQRPQPLDYVQIVDSSGSELCKDHGNSGFLFSRGPRWIDHGTKNPKRGI